MVTFLIGVLVVLILLLVISRFVARMQHRVKYMDHEHFNGPPKDD